MFSCLASQKEIAEAVFSQHADISSNESTIDCCETVIAVGKKEGFNDPTKACNVAIKTLQDNMPHRYQIIGDNLYMQINVKHMSSDKKNKSIHMFNMITIADEVSGNQLPNYHITTLQNANVADFLPSCDDIAKLKNDFLPLWTRVVVNQLKEFGVFKSSFQVPMNTVTLCNSHHVR